MKLDGTCLLDASRPLVWDVLNDGAILHRLLPGCSRFTQVGEHEYEVTVAVGVAAVKGVYSARVKIENRRAPESYDLTMNGKGVGGVVRGTARILLADRAEGTEVSVSGDGQVGGVIVAVGHRLLSAASQVMLAEFFRSLEREVKLSGRLNHDEAASRVL